MAKIKKIKLGSTTYDLCDAAATHKVDGVTGSTVNHFGTCSIAAGTAAKTVSITAGTFSLEAGAKVTVKFTNKNTASTPTLNVNSTGAKNIFHNGAQITTGGNKSLLYGTVDFVYDGTQWQLIGNYVDTHNSHTLSSGTKADGTTEIVGASSSGKLTLGASGVAQGAYGPGASENPASTGTITVPEITVNDKGIVVDATDRSLTLPSISIPNKSSSDTTDLVYAVSNLVESGVNGHTITPTYSGLPTKAYVDRVATGHVKYLGTATALTSLSTSAGQGDFYRVSTAFTFGSETAHVGDIILATKDNPARNATDWDLIHTEIDTNTWIANTKTAAGFVAKGEGNSYAVWQTDGSGNPAWRTFKDAQMDWGGRSIAGSISPVGASLSSEHSANRLAYLNPNALLFEYSDNAGSSWTDLQWTNEDKVKHVTTSASLYIGASPTVTTSHRSRMTITAQNGTSSYIYTRPRKLLINMCNNGHGVQCTLEYKTGVSGAAWNTLGTYDITGWSGWNEIDVSSLGTLGGHADQTSNYWYWRLTYKVTSINESYKTSRPYIIGLRLFGDTCWIRTSNMGETGHLYSYNWQQNATFPANVTATKFIGPLEGTATTATKLSNTAAIGSTTNPVYFTASGVPAACAYSLNKTVPSTAVFTDTKVTNNLNTTAKAYVTGTTTATTNTGEQVFDTGVYLDTTAGQLTATKFKGALIGNADSATTLKASYNCTCGDGTGGYIKICKLPLTSTYKDRTLELTITGRLNEYEKVKVQFYTSDPAKLHEIKIYTSGQNGNTFGVHGYHYNKGTAGSEYLELWCTLPTWDNVSFFKDHEYNTASSDVATWYCTKQTALPTTSTTVVKIDATLEHWSGTAANVAWSGVTSKPSYYDGKAITSISRSGTTFTATYLDGTTTTFTQQDTKVNTTLATTTKAYLLGTSTTPTSSAQAVTAIADTGVYLDTTAGKLTATTFKGSLEGNAATATTASQANTVKDKSGAYTELKNALLDMVYPVGSLYLSLNKLSPASFLGGTWSAVATGKTLIGAGNGYEATQTGGAASASFTLTSANMPSHTHSLSNHTHGLNGHTHSFTPSGTISSLSANTGSTALTTAANTGGLTAKSAGSHSHNVKWDIDGSGTGSQHVIRAEMNETKWGYMTTESAGSHSHSIDSHTHSISGHTHTMNHSHTFTGTQGTTGANNGSTATPSNNTSGSAGQASPTAVTISTLQPYLVVYMWQRTA